MKLISLLIALMLITEADARRGARIGRSTIARPRVTPKVKAPKHTEVRHHKKSSVMPFVAGAMVGHALTKDTEEEKK